MAGITSLHLSVKPRLSLPMSSSSRPWHFPVRVRVLPGMPLLSRYPRIYAFSSNDIKVGSNIEVDGAPWRVIEFLHVKPGKGAAFVRTKVRNYITGNTVEKTFRAGSTWVAISSVGCLLCLRSNCTKMLHFTTQVACEVGKIIGTANSHALPAIRLSWGTNCVSWYFPLLEVNCGLDSPPIKWITCTPWQIVVLPP